MKKQDVVSRVLLTMSRLLGVPSLAALTCVRRIAFGDDSATHASPPEIRSLRLIITRIQYVCLLFTILATSEVISGQAPTSESVHS